MTGILKQYRYYFLLIILMASPQAYAQNNVIADDADIVVTPAYEHIGVRWNITADDNTNSTMTLAFKRNDETLWQPAAQAMRAQPNTPINGGTLGLNYWAASALFLESNQIYQLRLTLTDPDGGSRTTIVEAETRLQLRVEQSTNVFYVEPGNGGGDGSMGNPYLGLQSAAIAAMPGDRFLVAAGQYAPFSLDASGTAAQPISFIGPETGEAVIDGNNTSRGIVTLGEDSNGIGHIIIQNLTIQNGNWGIDALHSHDIVVLDNIIRDVNSGYINRRESGLEYNQTICDNAISGRLSWPGVGIPQEEGVDLRGEGNAVCYNRIQYFGDCVSIEPQYGNAPRSNGNDVYGNDIAYCVDDGIEVDFNESNVRVWNNRVMNSRMGISLQPINGGPAYIFRNEIYNTQFSSFKMNNRPTGLYIVHNTSVKYGRGITDSVEAPWHNTIYRNNLLHGTSYAFRLDSVPEQGFRDLDYNAWGTTRDIGGVNEPFFKWEGVAHDRLSDLQAIGLETNGMESHYSDMLDAELPPQILSNEADIIFHDIVPGSRDLRLATNSALINAGEVLPNINDGYLLLDAAPDIGAFELGKPLPHYGPRDSDVSINQSPVATADAMITNQDMPVSLNVLLNDSDPDGDTLSLQSVGSASNGTVSQNNSNGMVTYIPNVGYYGSDSFTYQVADGNGGSTQGIVSVTVIEANVNGECEAVIEDAESGVVGGHWSVDNATISIASAGGISGNYVKVIHNNSVDGVNTGIQVEEDPGKEILSIDSRLDTDYYHYVDVWVRDALTQGLGYVRFGSPLSIGSWGTWSVNIKEAYETNYPSGQYGGIDRIRIYSRYRTGDQGLQFDNIIQKTSDCSNVSLNQPPVANADTLFTTQDISASWNVLTNDSDPDGDAISLQSISNASHGTVSLDNSNGAVTYTPNTGYFGDDSFTYQITDGSGGNAQGAVSVTVIEATTTSFDVTPQIAAKFLTQATFGASEAGIDSLVAQNNLEAWIDQQMGLPISRTQSYVEANGNGSNRTTRHDIWWKNVMEGDDQLRQRMTFALSQIFVISDRDYILGNAQYGITNFYDMLAENAFGNYREILEKVTLHPTMGIYLGMVRNQKANPDLHIRPDENYAREILQLFSVGLNELNDRGEALPLTNPVPTYTQETVENFAKVFTGWNFADSTGTWVSNDLTPYDKRLPMVADYNTPDDDSYHDTTNKTLLNGVQLFSSANSPTPAEDDMTAALDNIANHSNVPPFFSKLLIQRFTTSNPSRDYIERVASIFKDNGQGVRGDLGAVIKAILLDKEAIKGKLENPNFGKVKEPLLQLTQLWRAFDAQPGLGQSNGNYRLYYQASHSLDNVFGQAVLRSPSVFNFFLPDHLLSNDSSLLAPEMQIMTEANIVLVHNALRAQVYIFNNHDTGGWDAVARINIDKAVQLAPNSAVLIEYLDKLLLAGELSTNKKTIITDHLNTINDSSERAQEAIFLVIASAQFMVQE